METTKTMIIRTSHELEVRRLAREKGVDISFQDISWETVWYFMWGHQDAPRDVEKRDRAALAALNYTRVTFKADRPGDLLAVASREDGAPTFLTVPGADFKWTVEAMDAIDFKRCDRCNVRHDRIRVYMVQGQGQLGGSCAKSAAERLRSQVAFMNALGRMGAGWEDDGFHMGGAPKGTDPGLLLALAEVSIQAHGYVKSSEGGATKQDVLDMESVYRDGGRGFGAIQSALDGVDVVGLMAEAQAWLESLEDGDFRRNLTVALETGAYRLVAVLAYIPQGLRRAREDAAKAARKASSFPYDPTADSLLARLETFSPEELKLSKRDATKVFEGVAPSKGGAAKLSKCLAGAWTVMSLRSFEGFYGLTTYATFERKDGARVTWKASGSVDAEVGDVYRLRGSVDADVTVNERYGNERRIKRVAMLAV
ncbi:MAG: hypothetical protein V3S01_08115 [Dehalococcoidia bacterium]